MIALVAVASVIRASTPSIGVITASGHFTVERSEIWGNSTLFDGSLVETDQASSELALRNGVKMQLGAASRARVWENRVLLVKGVGQVAVSPAYEVDAGGLKIRSDGQAARVRVGIGDRVEVTALNGTARVASGAGVLLASIPSGRSMSFAMQAASTGTVMRTGCLLYKDGHFILEDETTMEVIELNGANLAPNTGNHIEITGNPSDLKPSVTIATSVVNVAGVVTKSQGGCLSVAAQLDAKTEAPAGAGKAAAAGAAAGAAAAGAAAGAAGAAGGAAAGAAAGLSTGAIVGIVAGVAAGGAGAALALARKKSSTSP